MPGGVAGAQSTMTAPYADLSFIVRRYCRLLIVVSGSARAAELGGGNIEAGFTTGFHLDPCNNTVASGQLPVLFYLWNGYTKTTEVFAKQIGVADFGQMAFHGCLP